MIPTTTWQTTQNVRASYNRIAPFYDRFESLTERRFKPWRERLWAAVPAGRVLEVGVGTGKNFHYHPAHAIVTGVDIADQMLIRAEALAQRLRKRIDLHEMDAQALDFPDGSFDAAAATFVFCSVPDPVRGLQEMARVVKPGGQLLLLEHVRVEHPVIGMLMDRLNVLVARLWGANINRRTVENARRAGLQIEVVESLGPMGMVKFIRATAAVKSRTTVSTNSPHVGAML